LNKKNALALSRINCNVSVSLDTLKSDRYKKIRGVDSFNKVKNNIITASKIKNKKGNWFINSTISEINYDEVIDLYDFAINNGFNFFSYPYNYSLCKASARDPELVFKNKDKIIKAFKKLVVKSHNKKDFINELIFKEVISYLEGDYQVPCDALKHSLMLDEQGRVSPCIELDYEFDLRKESIKDVWSRFNKDKVRDCYLKTPCFYGCTRGAGVIVNNWFKLVRFGLSNPGEVKRLIRML
jgi:MoaA/NifB/PqqE/SkfB family radical SAM enzyme